VLLYTFNIITIAYSMLHVVAVTVDFVFNATSEIAAADNFPDIRLFTVGFYNQLPSHTYTPQRELTGKIEQTWSVASRKSVSLAWKKDPANIWGAFSAVCWFFGRDLYQSLNGTVPIGLISTAIGGTAIQVRAACM
jgi:sialate O-acetylesterase